MGNLEVAPLLANALNFAFEKATTEGKATLVMLVIVSLFSWTVMITKARQLLRASGMSKKFFSAYRATRDPLEIFNKNDEYAGSPAYEVYYTGAEELVYHLKNNPIAVQTKPRSLLSTNQAVNSAETDVIARSTVIKVSNASFDSVKVALERTVSAQAISLEKGMIILSTAVAGGPFIGLLGTVWGVMETFSGIASAKAASLIAMAPGVAGALICTVVGLFVAIPAMFAYNYMITTIRALTQELDNFTAEYATSIEHVYVDNRPVSEEIADALKKLRTEEKAQEEKIESALV
jgi:biopolymer transport protein ExbB/TolQ